ncbi:MAG: phosphotransferase [Chloroflexi bacterium]|nr:phosphotransferase [Chloroflexota bacterium]
MLSLTHGQIRALLAEQFPELRAARIETRDTGGEHYTVAVGDDLVFRFPRDAATAAKTAREVAVLEALAPILPLPIPAVRFLGRPSASFPYPFTGQQRIRGVMGEVLRPPREHWPRLARQLGEFFTALHAFPRERALALGLVPRPLEPVERLIAETVQYRHLIGGALPAALKAEVAPYLDGGVPVPPPGFPSGAPTLVTSHTDLKGEHVFVSPDGSEVTGVIDWSDAALCDPVVDLQDLLIWLGAGFLRQVLDHYGGFGGYRGTIDEDVFERAVVYRRYECLRAIGVRLVGRSDDPLPLLITQLRWAFTDE